MYDKEFKQESIKKIYSNSMLRTKETSKERKNHFQENDKKDRKESKSNKPVRKLYLIQGKENLNNKKTKPDPQKKSKPLKK